MNEKKNLSFMDGFQFGCGFFVAGLVYGVIMMFVIGIGLGLFGGMLGAVMSGF